MSLVKKILLSIFLVLLVLLLLGAGVGWYIGFHDRGINRNFDARVIAESETRMWKAYYGGEPEDLGMEMVLLLRNQFGLSLYTAAKVVRPMAKGAMIFGRGGDNYMKRALPLIEESYARIAEACGKEKEWDAHTLAQQELAWWQARRTPGQDSPEQVGAIIAEAYAMLYGETNPQIEKAGFLRAKAAALRDQGGRNADWNRVESLLVESYTSLLDGISGN